jgi:hypothetical protein
VRAYLLQVYEYVIALYGIHLSQIYVAKEGSKTFCSLIHTAMDVHFFAESLFSLTAGSHCFHFNCKCDGEGICLTHQGNYKL